MSDADIEEMGYIKSFKETDPSVDPSVKDGVDWTEITNRPQGSAGEIAFFPDENVVGSNPNLTWNEYSSKLNIDGNAEISGDLTTSVITYSEAHTHYLSIPAAAFIPNTFDNFHRASNGTYFTSLEYDGTMVAAVYLPDGAKVTSFAAYVYDNDTNLDLTVRMIRRTPGSTTSEACWQMLTLRHNGAATLEITVNPLGTWEP